MAVLGFTTTNSQVKDQSEMVKGKGLEAFCVSVVDDLEGRHDPIGSSNAQLHLFMQLKRGNVTHMLFQSSEQSDVFFGNIESYYGKDKAERILSPVRFMAVGDAAASVRAHGHDVAEYQSLDEALASFL